MFELSGFSFLGRGVDTSPGGGSTPLLNRLYSVFKKKSITSSPTSQRSYNSLLHGFCTVYISGRIGKYEVVTPSGSVIMEFYFFLVGSTPILNRLYSVFKFCQNPKTQKTQIFQRQKIQKSKKKKIVFLLKIV